MDRTCETLIVGAGPIGIELHAALKGAGVRVGHVDRGPIGATMQWWAPGTKFFSSPERIEISGVPLLVPDQEKATREQYLSYLRGVVSQFDLDIRTYEEVVGIEREAGGFAVRTRCVAGCGGSGGGGGVWRADHVVLAQGDMHRPRLLGVEGEDLPHVSHYFADPHLMFRKRVLIVGGKNSAVEAAIRLHRVGCDVTISYRGEAFDEKRVKYWLHPEIRWLIAKKKIGFHPGTVPARITPSEVELVPVDGTPPGGSGACVQADFVFLLTGYEQDPSLFEMAGVGREGEGGRPVFNEETMETDARGVYVAGTAAAGTQVGGVTVFIETAHVHVERILHATTGAAGREGVERRAAEVVDLPES